MELTGREREALAGLAAAKAAQEVAENMGIAPRTLVNHLKNVLAKVEATLS